MYDVVTAVHYSAYRPPLHSVLLAKMLPPSEKRNTGLDIGCGTGCSSRELASYCSLVIGLEPSEAMLGKAEWLEGLVFVNASGEQIPLADRSVDIVTLAGSVNYIERDSLVNELIRICCPEAKILVYDFEVDLREFEIFLGIDLVDNSADYDHAANFHDQARLREITCAEDTISITTSPLELAHLLLSDRDSHDALGEKYNTSDPLKQTTEELRSISNLIPVRSSVFFSAYTLPRD